ncbi:MAG: thioredoxin domain-containing protein [Dongiaceae bacterium]
MIRSLAILLLAFGLAGPAALFGPGLSGQALAAEPTAFTQDAFAAAQAAGKPILIHVNASWCPTCAQQRPILGELEKSPELADLVVFTVDFDSQPAVLQSLNVQMQSTLIVFKGKTETGRATGITDRDQIRALLLTSKTS